MPNLFNFATTNVIEYNRWIKAVKIAGLCFYLYSIVTTDGVDLYRLVVNCDEEKLPIELQALYS